MNNTKLTEGQIKTLEFIKVYQEKYNTRPTNVEISQHLGITIAGGYSKVNSLLRKKILKLENNLYIIKN